MSCLTGSFERNERLVDMAGGGGGWDEGDEASEAGGGCAGDDEDPGVGTSTG